MDILKYLSPKPKPLDQQVTDWERINQADDDRLAKLQQLDALKKRHAQNKRKEKTFRHGFNLKEFILLLGVLFLITLWMRCGT